MPDDSDPPTDESPSTKRSFDKLGFALAIAWLMLLAYGIQQKWLDKLPLLGLVLLIVAVILAKHYILGQWAEIVNAFCQTLLESSRTSNRGVVTTVVVYALIGGITGWWVTIRHTTELVAGCSAAFGAILCATTAFLATQKMRQSNKEPRNGETNLESNDD